jgi:hypothetical protein
MPSVNVPGVGVVNFPEGMSQQDIINAIERESGSGCNFNITDTEGTKAFVETDTKGGPIFRVTV